MQWLWGRALLYSCLMSWRKISSFFYPVTGFLPSLFTIMLLWINSLKASCSASWSLTLHISLTPLLTYTDRLLLLLHDLDSLLPSAFHHTFLVPTPSAVPPLHISCSGSLPCPFDFRGMSALLALHALHARFSSGSPGWITFLMVYWVAMSPKSSPSVGTEACTENSPRLWLTEGSRDTLEGSYICSDCIYPLVCSNATFFILVCWIWHCRERAFINVPNISKKLLHMALPQFHFLSDQSRRWKEQSAQTTGGLAIQRHKAKVCMKNVSTIAQVVILFIYTATSIAPAQQVQFTCAG